jgi:hypothetical protein
MKPKRDGVPGGRYQLLLRWRDRWTLLIYALGVATTAFLVTAILFFLNESWMPGALSTVASLLTGAAAKWLLDRRQQAVSEEERAYQELRHDLKAEQNSQKGQQSRSVLVGRKNIKED